MKINGYNYYFIGNNLDKVDSLSFKIKNYSSTTEKLVIIYNIINK